MAFIRKSATFMHNMWVLKETKYTDDWGGYYFDREIGKTWVIIIIIIILISIACVVQNKIKIQQDLALPVMGKKKKEKKEVRTSQHW